MEKKNIRAVQNIKTELHEKRLETLKMNRPEDCGKKRLTAEENRNYQIKEYIGLPNIVDKH